MQFRARFKMPFNKAEAAARWTGIAQALQCVVDQQCMQLHDAWLMQVSCQISQPCQTILMAGTVQGSCLDDSTSCFELILEPSSIEVLLQHGSAPAMSSTSQKCYTNTELQSTAVNVDVDNPQTSGSVPIQPGLRVLIRYALP